MGQIRHSGNADCYLIAKNCSERFATTGKGNVVDFGRINACSLGKKTSCDVVRTTCRAAAPGNGVRISLELGKKIAEVLNVGRCRNDDGFVFAGEAGNWRDRVEIDGRIVGQDRTDHDIAANDELARVALVLVDELRQANRATCARNVNDLNAARNLFILKHVLHGACCLVPPTARCCWRLYLVIFSRSCARHCKRCHRRNGQNPFTHKSSLNALCVHFVAVFATALLKNPCFPSRDS